ncbi:MAG: DUF924 domain-containing protein [Acidobacteria bacterium]|nr:MAG: DUF924 domain-containing protein [Acidobacteriota bacterium]REK03346.1 MAG: DUF924 domain-containing protein [Acidobacteriota bacterium]
MTLHVFALNRRARRLYEGAGFDGEILRYRRKLSPSSTASATPDGAVEHPAFEWDHGEPPAEAADLLHFWFGASQPAEESPSRVAERQSKLWWQKDEATDREVRERFAPQLVPAERGDLDHWLRTPRGLLARVLLWDQVPRNVYRESPWAFAYDEGARRLTSLALERGADQLLSPIECLFLYLPLEHSESRSDQRRCVELFAALEARVPEDQRSVFEGFTGFARRHQEIVERFGRFPHRNQVLGRRSTVEEEEFLQQPGSSF